MYLIREKNIIRWKEHNGLTFLQCACRFTEEAAKENNEDLSKRKEIKELIQTLKKTNPYIEQNIFKSSENVNLDTLLSYKTKGIRHTFLENYDIED